MLTQATPRKNQRRIGKSADPNFTRTTIYLSNDLHHQIKVHAVSNKEDMSELVERVMTDYFSKLEK